MKQQPNTGVAGLFNTGISLQQLVNRVVSNLQETASHNNITVMNEVPEDFIIVAEEDKVGPVINGLLSTVVANGLNSRVVVNADRFRDIVILNIQDRNNNNGYALAFSIMSMESQAAEAGGAISIEGKQQKVATISFSFPVHLQAAC